jgi:hypothetical protein
MTLLSEYYVPGLHIEDRSIKVPLDWTGHEPGHGFDGESISLFYRVVTSPEHVHVVPVVPVRVRSAQVPMVGSRRPSSISAWCCRINVVRGVRLVSIRM